MEEESDSLIEDQVQHPRPKNTKQRNEMPEYWPAEKVPYLPITYC